MFHVNDRLLLGDGLFRETNQVFFGLHHSKKTNDFKNSICVCYFTEKRKIW